jgi:hypothetical protein
MIETAHQTTTFFINDAVGTIAFRVITLVP